MSTKTEANGNRRRQAAIHQAGHALVLVSKDIPFREVILPDDLPDETTDLPLSVSPDQLRNAATLNDQFAVILGGLEAERREFDPNAGSYKHRIWEEFTNHIGEWHGKEIAEWLYRWELNKSAGREIARLLIAQRRGLFDAIVAKLLAAGRITWHELLSLENEHRSAMERESCEIE